MNRTHDPAECTRGASVHFRKAALADGPALEALITLSARTLSVDDYSSQEIEAALCGAWGVDTDLIRDETYYVGECDGVLAICGGWSRRATAFGGDGYAGREARLLLPCSEAARIRAFFVHPAWARQGLASRLLALCEAEAEHAGFAAVELVATLTGRRFYARRGYAALDAEVFQLGGGVTIVFVPMRKALLAPSFPP